MTTKYTAGPWSAECNKDGATVCADTEEGRLVVAHCYARSSAGDGIITADARLIAAAPELVAALRAIADGDVMRDRPGFSHGEVVLAYQEIARKALSRKNL